MRGTFIAGALAGLLLISGLAYFYGGSQVPPGQPPLESVSAQNVADIRNQFNSANDTVRVLLLLSPT
jgi:hypothetical protein